jgi:hypothetical protein
VITAGHCVYIKGSNVPGRDGWVKKISVMPGRNASALPFGSVTSTVFRTVSGWTKTGGETFDYAAIILSTPLGDTVGVFGNRRVPRRRAPRAEGQHLRLPRRQALGRAVGSTPRKWRRVNANKVFYDIDTSWAARAAAPSSGS